MVPQRIIKTLAVRDELNRHQTRADYSIWHILTLYITNEVVFLYSTMFNTYVCIRELFLFCFLSLLGRKNPLACNMITVR